MKSTKSKVLEFKPGQIIQFHDAEVLHGSGVVGEFGAVLLPETALPTIKKSSGWFNKPKPIIPMFAGDGFALSMPNRKKDFLNMGEYPPRKILDIMSDIQGRAVLMDILEEHNKQNNSFNWLVVAVMGMAVFTASLLMLWAFMDSKGGLSGVFGW